MILFESNCIILHHNTLVKTVMISPLKRQQNNNIRKWLFIV